MTERAFQVSHRLVRVSGAFTLLGMGLGLATDKYYPAYSRAVVNSLVGTIAGWWILLMPLLLPPYVGFEVWWMRKSRAAMKGLWLDALLAITCFLSLVAIVLYAWSHYAMF